jgi:2-dehydro-3-deoxyglucarate aldolase/4-hydroxy-2-oxoheptanedioate aldolase
MSYEALVGHLTVARGKQVPALVRVTSSDTAFIKPVIDLGAEGIIVPQIRSAEEVRHVVDDCRYPPLGRRGYGPHIPSNYGRDGGEAYVARANENLFVSVQIENMEAYTALDDILEIVGLDSVVIGPQDLSGSMGILGQTENPQVVEAIQQIIAKAHEAGKYVGTGLGNNAEYAALMAKRGINWLQVGGDYSFMIDAANQTVTDFRKRLAQP